MPRPRLNGRNLQKAVIERAHAHGWRVAHFRAAQVRPGVYVTPMDADGKGFPDLVLVRKPVDGVLGGKPGIIRPGRVLFVEIKGDGDRLRPEQKIWLESLQAAGMETYVWTSKSWPDQVEEVLASERRTDWATGNYRSSELTTGGSSRADQTSTGH